MNRVVNLIASHASAYTPTAKTITEPIPHDTTNQTKEDNQFGDKCWHGPFNKQLCCVVQDPRCWDATYTFAKCCPEEYIIAQKGAEKRKTESWIYHLESASSIVSALIKSSTTDEIVRYELVWEAANNLLAAVQTDSANLDAWQQAGKTMIELSITASTTEFPPEPLYIYGLSMLEHGCLTPADMEKMATWATKLVNTMTPESSGWSDAAIDIGRLVQANLLRWHGRIEIEAAVRGSPRELFVKRLKRFTDKDGKSRTPASSELNKKDREAMAKLLPSKSKTCRDNPDLCQEIGFWDLLIGKKPPLPSSIEKIKSNNTAPSKSTIISQPELFPTRVTKRHFGEETMWKRIAKIALAKFGEYDAEYIKKLTATREAHPDNTINYTATDVNNAFFGWQQRRTDTEYTEPPEIEQSSWPELDASIDVQELRKEIKSVCADYMQEFLPEEYHASLYSNVEVVDWVSVLVPGASLAFHDHPLATVSGTFYVQVPKDTPILFADPRGHAPYRYPIDMKRSREWAPSAPFHRVQPVNVESGDLLLFPPWLLHTVKPNLAGKTRVTFPFNCFFSGENSARLDSWFLTAGALK